MYHSVNDHPEKHPQGFLAFSTEEFELHLSVFKNMGYEILSLKQVFELDFSLVDKSKKIAVLTFDDGFLDNLNTVSPILKSRNITATVFINTDLLNQTNRTDYYGWGFLNVDELKELHSQGTFDIQSHTHSHSKVFVSNKVIDYYSSDKFDKYYWLVWLFFPDLKNEWHGDIRRFKNKIPDGFPILEHDRGINQNQYVVKLDELATATVESNSVQVGYYETDEAYEKRIYELLNKPKNIVKEILDYDIEHVCFPGGAYNERVIKVLSDEGFKSYMLSSSEQKVNTAQTFSNVSESPVKVSRISFTLDYPSYIPKKLSAFISVYFKLKFYEGNMFIKALMSFMKKLRNILR